MPVEGLHSLLFLALTWLEKKICPAATQVFCLAEDLVEVFVLKSNFRRKESYVFFNWVMAYFMRIRTVEMIICDFWERR